MTKALEGPKQSIKTPQWTNMGVCIAMGIDLKSEYPASSYLFQCLGAPGGDPVAAKVAAASRITSSSKLEDISRCLCDLSAALTNISATKASQLLKTLQNKQTAIFPITYGARETKYGQFDKLVGSKTKDWYIADLPDLRNSFIGVLPLLALSVEDISSIQELLAVLRLDDRILSKLTVKHAHPRGRVATHQPYMSLLNERMPFIKA